MDFLAVCLYLCLELPSKDDTFFDFDLRTYDTYCITVLPGAFKVPQQMSACVLPTLGYEESRLNSYSQLYCVRSKLCEVPFSYMSLPVYVV